MFYQFTRVDTRAGLGAEHPFSPEAGWEGDGAHYRRMMRERFKNPAVRAVLLPWARFYRRDQDMVRFIGPYADEAKSILNQL